jgi:gliding motility-associated-like protein
MKKKIIFLAAALTMTVIGFAAHITGGEVYYTYAGLQANGDHRYNVTLKLYRDCNSTGAQLDPSAGIGIFNRATGVMVWNQSIARSNIVTLNLGSPDPCISNPPVVCYQVGYYEFSVDLPASSQGYIISYQRCCRISGVTNVSNSGSVGATYTAEIPGNSVLATAPQNNSAQFIGADTVVVCKNSPIIYDFSARDGDNDQLSYSFCSAYFGASQGTPAPGAPSSPPYGAVPYSFPFTSFEPLGSLVSINPATGLITGITPAAGIYVVTVCVNEIRNGQVIATQRKDLQIKVADCETAKPTLDPEYVSCDGFTWNFSLKPPVSSLIQTLWWDFGVPSLTNDTANVFAPTFTYPDTGTYLIKVVANRGLPCSDSATAIMKVYPGFFPGFTTSGICVNRPTQFTDTTNTTYGVVDTWKWNFGVLPIDSDTSRLQNPTYTFTQAGTYNVQFIVTNSKGCIDTVLQDVTILDKPPLSLPFRDTLICIGDQLQLQAIGNGVFTWTPNINITNANTATPTVSPPNTTMYYVNLNDNGCINNDSVRVRVVSFVTLNAIGDTTICQGDQIQLNAASDGLQFSWTPVTNVSNPNIINPIATTTNTTVYTITATIGGCDATDNLTVTTVPYPVANAGPDTTICYNSSAQLNGSMNGTSFTWTPVSTLIGANTLTPVAYPPRTQAYVLSAFNTLGCPKPGSDTVVVTVLPRIRLNITNDTMIIVGQPLQLNASGAVDYVWSPSTGLNSTIIPNPIAILNSSIDSIRYKVYGYNEADCVDSAFVNVKVFKTNPSIFVPSAFTPNGDGRNDLIRPIAVGMQKIEYFSIYNRWGQLVFTTGINGHGWDGRIAGKEQSTETYVWIVRAIDYTGKLYVQKGTVTLIR